jgi:ribose 5-phosphate isomerase
MPGGSRDLITIDGADEVEHCTLNLIKGLGGALLREKIVAAASHRLAIVVDGSKMVERLGTRTSLPVEVVAFDRSPEQSRDGQAQSRRVARRWRRDPICRQL